ncbi:MAG TPA: hypothetical protein VLG27_02035 [Candidatus Saccharimonadia bacterium]|nr:hypothetical protein [Candidatus Saccharimonadia bacterium]
MPKRGEIAEVERIAVPIPNRGNTAYVALARRVNLISNQGDTVLSHTRKRRFMHTLYNVEQDRSYNPSLHFAMRGTVGALRWRYGFVPVSGDFVSQKQLEAQDYPLKVVGLPGGPIENYVVAQKVTDAMLATGNGHVTVKVDTDVQPIYGNWAKPLAIFPDHEPEGLIGLFKYENDNAVGVFGRAHMEGATIDEALATVEADMGFKPSELWTPPALD